jgi:LPXTG-site transpeptidase (sortase) family protein
VGSGGLARIVISSILSFALVAPLSFTPPFAAPSTRALTYVKVSRLEMATPATWISIPRLRINMAIREGNLWLTSAQISSRFAHHYPGSSWPGGHSNTYLYAHARVGAFLNLKNAVKGDIVNLRVGPGRWVKYRVTRKYNVTWNAVSWVLPTNFDRLTLQTCLGAGRYARKVIVTAVPVP